VFRRRRREGGDQPGPDDQVHAEDLPGGERNGPWDIADDYPAVERIDCGSLLIPVRDNFDVQINVAEEQGVWVAVVHGESGMQLQAFAAPRNDGLWDEVRDEIAANIAESGGSCQEEAGPAGTELLGQVPLVADERADHAGHGLPGVGQPGVAEPGRAGTAFQPVRFIGFDGPRWFLRGVISGPAAQDRSLGVPFAEVFANVVVVRGDHPVPPREQLEIRLPEEARQALEEQFAEQNPGWELPNPFERGPEITETR
jgi:hypothetical protein